MGPWQSSRTGSTRMSDTLACDAITRHRIKQADLTGINSELSGFAQTVAKIRRYPTERALIAQAQYNDGFCSSWLDHFHLSSYGKDSIWRVTEMSCRLGDAFGPNAEHNLAASPALGHRWYREPDNRLTVSDDGHGPV